MVTKDFFIRKKKKFPLKYELFEELESMHSGERRKEAVLGKKSKEISVETEGTADLFHSCRRCDCNAKSLHPSHSEKTVWKEGAAEMHHLTHICA